MWWYGRVKIYKCRRYQQLSRNVGDTCNSNDLHLVLASEPEAEAEFSSDLECDTYSSFEFDIWNLKI